MSTNEFDYDWSRLEGLGFDINYVEKTTGDLKEACWKGYTAVGMKKKKGRMVPNCVPLQKKHAEFSENPFQATEPNGGMILTQLKVAREKIDMLLAMMEPEDNLEPWAATKVANAGVALASVADYLRFGGET